MSNSASRLNAALEGRYRIERQLGEGGMATVFLADDLRHARRVALKVLKPELAAVVGAERFLGEIRTTASLQHPHILPLFDSGTADGFLFYVMPYVEGESLRQRLDRERQLPVREAVALAISVAGALDYAHRRGVIHRDIKPANILLHDGQPVVADFGIALALGVAGGGRLTDTGLSLGTPHYMSPEQATGDTAIGPASDIYALGCVLYEMLVGEPPHKGSTPQAVLGRIVMHDADAVSAHRRSVPANVDAAVEMALEKVPADRFASAADFRAALGDAAFEGRARVAGAARGGSRRLTVALGAALAGAVMLAAWGWLRATPSMPVARFATELPLGDPRDAQSFATTVAISPDGGSIVFRDPPAGAGQLYLKRREDLEAQPLAGTEGGTGPFFSPDGAWIGFFVRQEMRRVPISGGTSLRLVDSININYPGGAWLDDGSIVFHAWPDLRILPPDGGASRVIAPRDGFDGQLPWLPKALPDSRGVLFITCGVSGTSSCALPRAFVYDTRNDSLRLVLPDAAAAMYTPTGHLIYLTASGSLMAVRWDNDALATVGSPVALMDGVQAPGLAVSDDGTLLYVLGPQLYRPGPASNAEAIWVDRSGAVEPVDPSWKFNTGFQGWGVALSPDGERLAIRLLTDLGTDVWIKRLPAGALSRLTFYDGEDGSPRWTPDGRFVTFLSDRPSEPGGEPRTGQLALWRQLADGSRDEAEPVWTIHAAVNGFEGADGVWAVLTVPGRAAGEFDIVAVQPGRGSVADSLLDSPYDERAATLSPDGTWLAYVSNETGADEVFVTPFPGADRNWQVSSGSAGAPLWAHDGRTLFYAGGGDMNAVDVDPGPPFVAGQPRVLFPLPTGVRQSPRYVLGAGQFALTSDDQRFLMVRDVDPWVTTAPPKLVLMQNFFEELRARAQDR
jgi:serine/threonine-protein kinase